MFLFPKQYSITTIHRPFTMPTVIASNLKMI